MDVITLRPGQSVSIGQGILLSVIQIPGKAVRIVVDAPTQMTIEKHDGTVVNDDQLRQIIAQNPPVY